MNFYTSDLHLGHKNIIEYDCKPVTLDYLLKGGVK